MKFAQFAGKKIVVTGHTGFKGSWLCQWLLMLDAKICGIALEPETSPNLYGILGLEKHIQSHIVDIRDQDRVTEIITAFKPDIIFHLAAQPLVRRSYKLPLDTLSTNVMGTAHILEAARQSQSVKAIVSVTTDKCYRNPEDGVPFTEDDPLGGHDIYSASKACAEIVSHAYRMSFLSVDNIAMATARAGNVIGGGDFSEDRILPDAIRAIEKDEPLLLRSPHAVRPWQHVLDVIEGYLMLASYLLLDHRDRLHAFNFAPIDGAKVTVHDLVTEFYDTLGRGKVDIDQLVPNCHEAKLLTLNANLAKETFGWTPKMDTQEAIERTAQWYSHWLQQDDMVAISQQDIQAMMRT